MILVDTSIWIDHLRHGDELLASFLNDRRVLIHPYVIGEIALGNFRDRTGLLHAFARLPKAVVAKDAEVLLFIDRHRLAGTGIGYVDAHLLASVRLTPDAAIWTRDRRMLAAAERIGIGAKLTH